MVYFDMIHDSDFVHIVRTRRKIFALLFTVALFASAAISIKRIYYSPSELPRYQTYQEVLETYQKAEVQTRRGKTELLLEIADSPEKRAQGLMFRRSLAKNSGMLFVFENDTTSPFWMKNTLMSLDIFFVAVGGRIVDLATMDPCHKEPCALYGARLPYRYAVEVLAGFIKDNELRVGDAVRLGE